MGGGLAFGPKAIANQSYFREVLVQKKGSAALLKFAKKEDGAGAVFVEVALGRSFTANLDCE